MKRFLASVVGATLAASLPTLAAAQPAPATQSEAASKLAEARAIIAVAFPTDQREAMYEKLQSDLVSQMMPKDASWMQEPGVKKILDAYIAEASTKQREILLKYLPEQMEAMAGAYVRRFTLAELKEIHIFANSSAGSHYLSQSMAIVGDPGVAKVNSALLTEVRRVTEGLAPQFKDKLVAYLKANPEIAKKLEAQMKASDD